MEKEKTLIISSIGELNPLEGLNFKQMKNTLVILIVLALFSCKKNLMEPPENLILKEDMVDVLYDLAIMNAFKNTNNIILKSNNIDPTTYVFQKYEIDSLQFVESDRYYAALPDTYEELYVAVEERLNVKKEEFEENKKIKDSLDNEKRRKKRQAKSALKTAKDSLR